MNILKNITYVLSYWSFFIMYLVVFYDFYFLSGALFVPFLFSITYITVLNFRKELNFNMISGSLNFFFSLMVFLLFAFVQIDFLTFFYIQAILFIILVIDTFF